MKMLIAYDGSSCSEAALDDLVRAGLPDEAEAVVLTVAEVWLPPPPEDAFVDESADEISSQPPFKQPDKHGAKALSEAKSLARHAQKRLQIHFPNWRVKAETGCGSAAWEIITEASRMRADLIVVGSRGRGSVGGRFILGSVSQKVLSESHCSVRVSRGRIEVDPLPSCVVIAYDGSPGANAAIEAVASRNWREQSEFRLITVADQVMPTAIGRFVPPIARWVEDEIKAERAWIEKINAPALEKLREAGLSAKTLICAGNPKQMLVEEAEKWHADSIFVGANHFGCSGVERFLLGSVSAAVAARASCSVEVIRKSANDN